MTLSTTNLVRSANGVYADNLSRLTDLDLLACALNDVLWSGIKTQLPKNQAMVNIATVALAYTAGRFVIGFNDHNLDNRVQAQKPDLGNLLNINPAEIAVVGRVTDAPAQLDSKAGEVLAQSKNKLAIVTQVKGRAPNTTELMERTIVPKFQNGDIIFSPKASLRTALEEMLANDMVSSLGGMNASRITILLPSNIAFQHAEMRILRYCRDGGINPGSLGVSKPCCHECAQELDDAGVAFTRWSIVRNMRGWTEPTQINNTTVEMI